MKKRLTALLLAAVLVSSTVPAVQATFLDIQDEETRVAAAVLQGMGVVSGLTETTFGPEQGLNRAQVCTMVVRAMGLSAQVSTHSRKTLFSDVMPSAWYNGYVNLAYAEGLVNGKGDGTFGPEDPITYGQMATILLRMLGYTTAQIGSVWPLDYTSFCDDLGLSEGLGLSPNQTLTRGEAAVLLYRAMKENRNGGNRPYYQTVETVVSTGEAIVLDCDADYGGESGLLMAYSLSGSGSVEYYRQENGQDDLLTGMAGTLLFDDADRVIGFMPDGSTWLDVTIADATASSLTDAGGSSYRISSGAKVIAGENLYSYSTGGYLQLDNKAGKNVRLFYDDSGAITYLYLTGGSAVSSTAVVAQTTSPANYLARELDITGKSYAITKNGVAATVEDLAQYDVGYYDQGSGTLCVSDWKVTGYITQASPSVTAAQTITVMGCEFEVLECAWDTLADFELGHRVTLLLTDDGKVAAVCAPREVTADMVGVLAADGKSVTLSGSGVVLKAASMEYKTAAVGGLVTVKATDAGTLRCDAVTNDVDVRKLDLTAGTAGGLELAPSYEVYEWAGKGYVYDLEGNRGAASSDLSAITWTDELPTASVSYVHLNSAGEVDVVLLNDVTGNLYTYGKITRYEGQEGIDLGNGIGKAYNDAAVVSNSSGTSEKYVCTTETSGTYGGVAMGSGTYHSNTHVVSFRKLTAARNIGTGDFFLQDDSWFVQAKGNEYPVSGQVEIYLEDTHRWMGGESGLTAILADDYEMTLYYDALPSEGGQIRVIVASH